ncbi:LysM peptidoglycan-binding domain-containing protein [Paenibacillus monticola]|uniref:LysM peptidoglycan-binding domain-containing protein n=1 Tax=Paenibacillus monticola TaxID=2666075 RepID=A0A7X2HBP3_9BACL|nr:LysM peptidoglycan-binding domain-containing protein [Paenibacillus monticola]
MEEYGIFLSFNNQEDLFRLPINPETLEIKESGDGKSYTIIDLGEINAIAYPKLTEISIESVFPAQRYPFVLVPDAELRKPFDYVELIKKWMVSRRPIRFVFSGVKIPEMEKDEQKNKVQNWLEESKRSEKQSFTNDFAINMAVSIEGFTWKLSAGTSGDIEYTLSLKKYVFYQAVAVKVVNGEAKAEQKRASEKKAPATYTLKAGDSLWSIAQKIFGDGSKYKAIQKLNGIPDSELKKLPVGKVIKLP